MQFALDDMPYFLKAFFAALSTLWLWMFFPPMHKLGLVFGMNTFIPFLLALFAAQLVPYLWVRIVVALIAAQTYIVYHFRLIQPFPTGTNQVQPSTYGFSHDIIPVIHEELGQAATLLHTGHLVEPFQTHLFLFALAIIYWLLTYASQRPRLWLFYNVLGILVLAIIDGNTNVHPNTAIVVDSLIAFFVLGLSRYAQLRLHFEQFRWPAMRFLGPLLAVIIVATGAAWLLPKAPAAWADPFKGVGPGGNGGGGLGLGTGSGSTQQIGYQENNQHLGGSFVMNYTPVLKVTSPYPVYLRGKVYSDYTGKGWKAGNATYSSVQAGDVSTDPNTMLSPSAPTQQIKQTIQVLSNRLKGDTVFGAYSISKLTTTQPSAGPLQVNLGNGDVIGAWEHSGVTYSVISKAIEDPTSNLQLLSALPSTLTAREKMFAGDVGTQDLQLPSELPKRVTQLTDTLVKGDTTEYQMVQAVEDYLQGYRYQITNIPRPGKNQDYVDQFLFQSKAGYCNNFSSSMAVMLRSIGIPTRWVTGFADGQQNSQGAQSNQTTTSSGLDQYTVRESDAHSWVEVYFPKYGWIPFDPTPGFSFPYLANPNPAGGQSNTQTPPASKTPPAATKTPPQSSASGGGGISIPWQAIWSWTWKVVLALVALTLIGVLAFRKRVLLRVYMWLWKQDTPSALTRGMIRLLHLLRRRGWLRQNALTIRDLESAAARSGISEEAFHSLVVTVEKTWYSPEEPSIGELKGVRQTWLQWIRAVIMGKSSHDSDTFKN